ncbi:indolepyruvate ferredoxin oxidoreductase subunit alpha [Cytobacillus purgationiresistens]|uniref:Ferredoxin n=1 Tax=Cytobacillus purgationiresistens TaxID=863449 RepID=A0ABU0AQ37_9BACI|nr:ferredoxin family protein [Cytobacillus purgationiresistens]MDQ0273401.1 NAD-dependent dihydropyrimidine dehydrogenase PreA subunit [Cytobacillus purgationiresistens]
MAYVITSPCINEQAGDCLDACPVDCIEKGEDQYLIDPATCIDCGACETVCPVEAIVYEEDLEDEQRVFFDKAKQYFNV